MSKLMDRLKKTNTIKIASVLADSEFFNDVDETATEYPAINIALSGTIDGGLKSGIMTIAGPSRHFKSAYALMMASSYLKKHKEGVLLFYDSEFGTPSEYFTAFGIDPTRVMHVPVKNLEELKFDLMQQLEATNKGDKLFILIDSIGNLASLKEATDALDGKSVADLSRAKYLKGLYRIVTPYLRTKDIPLVQIGHIYMCGTDKMKVKTPNGNVGLSTLNIGDEVYTTAGVESVQNVFKYEDVPVSIIELEDGTKLEFTEFHRFMVNGEWLQVSELSPGMILDTI